MIGLILTKTLMFSSLGIRSAGFVGKLLLGGWFFVFKVELWYLCYFEYEFLLDLCPFYFFAKSIVISFCFLLKILFPFDSSRLWKKFLNEL